MVALLDEAALVAQFGSPCYVYDVNEVRAALQDLRSAVPADAMIYYSVKANPHPAIGEVLSSCGVRAEISSEGELRSAIEGGFSATDILYTGPGKTKTEVDAALRAGVRQFSMESVPQVRLLENCLSERKVGADVLLRINGAQASAAASLRMTNVSSPFGFELDQLAEGMSSLDRARMIGLHFYSLSNAGNEDVLRHELVDNLQLAKQLSAELGVGLKVIDLGGGFASPFAGAGTRPQYPNLRQALSQVRAALDFEHVELAFESGRYLVGTCGTLLTTVTSVKRSKGRTYVVLDSGVNHLGGMPGLRRMRPMMADFEPVSERKSSPDEAVSMVGPLCTPLDVVNGNHVMPLPRPGDLLRVRNVGAYGLTASLMGFLSRPCPVEVITVGNSVTYADRTILDRAVHPAVRSLRSSRHAGRVQTTFGTCPPSPVALARELLPVLNEHASLSDHMAAFPQASFAALRASRLMGLLVPQEYGGLGGSLSDLTSVGALLAEACLSTALAWAMHCQQVDAMVRHASPALAASVLPAIAEGRCYLGSVTTEHGKGGHLLTAQEELRQLDEHLVLDRDAPIVTGGFHADAYLVTMRTAPGAPENSVSLVYADRSLLDVSKTRDWDTMGMRGTESVGLRITGKIPQGCVVGAPGRFRDIALDSFVPLAHLSWAACWLGSARGALSGIIRLARTPRSPVMSKVKSELVQSRLAMARVDLEAVSAYLERVTAEVESARCTGDRMDAPVMQIHLNALKLLASERTISAVRHCIQLAGLDIGYRRDSAVPLERVLRDLTSASLNYSNDRLLTATGILALADSRVSLLGDTSHQGIGHQGGSRD